MKITYIHHSAFLVETESAYLLFDYFQGKLPEFSEEKPLYVFASHRHPDHFSKVIFDLEEKHPNIHYILAFDIWSKRVPESCKEKTRFLNPGQVLDDGTLKVEGFKSTDEGVAFWCSVDGLGIYHAGDLNWWHWNGESDAFNNMIKKQYTSEISKIKGVSIDIGFVPVDPRLEDKYILAIDYNMQNVDIKHVFPMHFWQEYAIYNKLMGDPRTKEYRERIEKITKPGQVFKL